MEPALDISKVDSEPTKVPQVLMEDIAKLPKNDLAYSITALRLWWGADFKGTLIERGQMAASSNYSNPKSVKHRKKFGQGSSDLLESDGNYRSFKCVLEDAEEFKTSSDAWMNKPANRIKPGLPPQQRSKIAQHTHSVEAHPTLPIYTCTFKN